MQKSQLQEKVLSRLQQVYQQEDRKASPMSEDELNALKIPAFKEKLTTIALPWDLRFLLAFDRNLVIGWDDAPLFRFITDGVEAMRFGPDHLLRLFEELGIIPFYDDQSESANKAKKILAPHSTFFYSLLNLSQIGGDEIPYLLPAENSDDCSMVLHFDYDELPQFYIRNTCLLNYVMQYLTEADGENAMDNYVQETGLDSSLLLSDEENNARYLTRRDELNQMNNDILLALESLFENYED